MWSLLDQGSMITMSKWSQYPNLFKYGIYLYLLGDFDQFWSHELNNIICGLIKWVPFNIRKVTEVNKWKYLRLMWIFC